MTVLIEIDHLHIHSRDDIIVEDLSLQLIQGTPLTILGETGSGKSLLAQAIMGLLPEGLTRSGHIHILGKHVNHYSGSELQALWGRTLVMLPQEPWHSLDPLMKAYRQIADVFRYVRGLASVPALVATEQQLQFLGLQQAGHKRPGELSGGMAQRVAFAAATAGGADIMLADEPTKGLDASRRDDIVRLLKQHANTGGLLTITHDVEVARQLGGQIMVMQKGRVLEQGDADQILNHPQSDYARALIAASPRNWPVNKPDTLAAPQPLLQLENLSMRRGGHDLFANLNLTINRGEIIGLCGDSGCGKSTLGDIILGLLKPDHGQIRYLQPVNRHQCLKLYQDPPSAFADGPPLRQLLQDLIDLHQLDEQRIPVLLEQLQLSADLLQRSCSQVSGGELQRVAILRALLMDPVLLVADEPTSRLDPLTTQTVTQLMVSACRQQQCSLILISHDHEQLSSVCDWVINLADYLSTP
ncbi:ABC transporter ATP-binding protein [Gynuella sp.]|uniref:ABC transporter ATP-binding protein n=1 Tax=Gynuella sp. TaxID=2969146 RepID=UPI003D0DF885